MKKIILSLALALTFLALLAVSAAADSPVVGSKQYLYVEDGVDILTDEQKADLTARLQRLSDTYQIDVAIAVFQSIYPYGYSDDMDFADSYYEDNGFGRGSDRSGIVLVRIMDTRAYTYDTAGSCKATMSDEHGLDYYDYETGLVSALKRDDYYTAFSEFINGSEFLLNYEKENGYAYGDEPVPAFSLARTVGSLFTGFLGGLIPVSGMKSKLKTVRQQVGANAYARENSVAVTRANDLYIGHHVTRTVRQTERSSGGGGGHYSSSGMHHGGRTGHA
ncbi:MAG: TPM domain-containing protein [Clostridia bacterium]|nr:TPM domain-containing protein [Clostridia bacterium]